MICPYSSYPLIIEDFLQYILYIVHPMRADIDQDIMD
jgi:hypothetical protein